MTKATGQEGPRAPLFYCALLIAPAQLALAQSVDVAELARCAGLGSEAAKLACFEALVEAHAVEQEVAPEPAAEAVQPEAVPDVVEPQPTREAPVAAAPAAPVPAAQPLPTAEPTPAAAPAEDRTPVAASAPVAATPAPAVENPQPVAAASSEAVDPMASLGVREPEAADVEATVTEVSKDSYGRLVFHFENGQQWRQIEKRFFPYPKNAEFDVTISEGMMGEQRLQVEGRGRRVAIRRLK